MGTGAKSHFYSGWRFGFFVGNQTGSAIFDQHLQLELVPELPRASAVSNGGCTTAAWCRWQRDSPRDMAWHGTAWQGHGSILSPTVLAEPGGLGEQTGSGSS